MTPNTIRMILRIGLPEDFVGAAIVPAGAAPAMTAGGATRPGAGGKGGWGSTAAVSPTVVPHPVQNFIPSARGLPHFVQNCAIGLSPLQHQLANRPRFKKS